MSFPFSPIGSFIYLVYVSAILAILVFPLWKWILKEKKWKWWLITPIAFPLLAAPVIEELWISYNFNKKCQNAGIHVIQKVEAGGYLDATGSGPTNAGYLKNSKRISIYEKSGFKFKEFTVGYRLPGNKISRVEKQENGKWLLTIQDRPTARYHLLHTHNHFKVGHQLTKMQRIILDKEQNKIISRDTKYARYPGFIDGLWIRFLGDGQNICSGSYPGKSKLRSNLLSYTLTPTIND